MLHKLTFNAPDAPHVKFAGFTYPRPIATMPAGPLASRKARRKHLPLTGPYYWRAPRMAGTGAGFYLDSDGMPCNRWKYADEIDSSIGHRGWYTDDAGTGCKVRGIVFRLPHTRGFLAGWTYGENMTSGCEARIHQTEIEAARYADECARVVAENELENDRRENEQTE